MISFSNLTDLSLLEKCFSLTVTVRSIGNWKLGKSCVAFRHKPIASEDISGWSYWKSVFYWSLIFSTDNPNSFTIFFANALFKILEQFQKCRMKVDYEIFMEGILFYFRNDLLQEKVLNLFSSSFWYINLGRIWRNTESYSTK